ncbi:MAG TPA: alpha/beta fold hydrolase [Candidatus Limnocylindrales bacterium]|nr:alpha/beta fold hydrolase [Candidatus Limnocylindrales bacterium]
MISLGGAAMKAFGWGSRSGRRRAGIWAALVVAIGALGASPTIATAQEHDPVLLVHGFRGDPSTWADMKTFLESQGRVVAVIDLTSEDNVVNAKAIANFLKQKRWKQVDLVGQSMGGLSSRHFVKFVPSRVKVDAYVSLGTPQYGIWSACVLPSWYGGQMCPTSSFLANLNAGDDTPGTTAWTTIYSTGDQYVPNDASRLDGGACHVRVDGIGHNEMDNDPGVMAHVLSAIDGGCPGTFVP